MSRRLVLDCDPGCDDALALLLAFQADVYSHIDILTVAGNVGIRQTTANARRLCAFANWHGIRRDDLDLKLYKGSGSSLRGEIASAASVHGRDGLGDVPLEVLFAPGKLDEYLERHAKDEDNGGSDMSHLRERFLQMYPDLQQQTAIQHLCSFASKEGHPDDEEVDLVCTGPLTNLALALQHLSKAEQQSFWNRWKRVVFMGGAIRESGNISYAAEFNVHADPDAFALVLKSLRDSNVKESKLPIVMPLDVTENVVFWAPRSLQKQDDFRELGDVSKALLCLLRKYFLFHAISYPPPLSQAVLDGEKREVEDSDWLSDQQSCKLTKTLRKAFRRSRQRGGGGLKVLPLWCYLHDPSALWIAKSCYVFPDSFFEVIHLQVNTAALSSGRGHLNHAQPRRSFFTEEGGDQRNDLLRVRSPKTRQVVQELQTGLIPALQKLVTHRSESSTSDTCC